MEKISIKAIFIGLVVDIGGSLITGIAIGIVWAPFILGDGQKSPEQIEALYQSNMPLMWTTLVIGLFFVFLGGFTAAMIAPAGKILNACMVGVLGIPLGLPFAGSWPLWFNVITFSSLIPVAYLGGCLCAGFSKSED